MDKNKTYGVVAAVIVIIIIIAVAAWYVTSNDDNGSDTPTDEGDTYYFYLDGMDDLDGWYTGVGDNPALAIEDAFTEASITYEWNGDMLVIEDYVNTYDPDALTGVGNGVYFYNSTDVINYVDAANFVIAPAIVNIPGNVIYISYGPYSFNADYSTNYDLCPTTTESDMLTTGPFSGEYVANSYDEYYFYLDGFSDDIDGWYTGVGDNPALAIEDAFTEASITYEWNGDMLVIEDYVNTYDPTTESGVGNGIAFYYSTDLINYVDSGNFVYGPAIEDIPGNVIYISYGPYSFNSDYSTNYDLNPETTTSDMLTTGPFATA